MEKALSAPIRSVFIPTKNVKKFAKFFESLSEKPAKCHTHRGLYSSNRPSPVSPWEWTVTSTSSSTPCGHPPRFQTGPVDEIWHPSKLLFVVIWTLCIRGYWDNTGIYLPNLSVIKQYFSFTTNQKIVLSTMASEAKTNNTFPRHSESVRLNLSVKSANHSIILFLIINNKSDKGTFHSWLLTT